MNYKLGFLISLVVLASALRLPGLDQYPVSTYWDETAIGVDAWFVATTGQDMHGNSWLQPIFPSYGDYKMPVYIWITSLVMQFTGPETYAVRLPSALAGILLVVVLYAIGKTLGGVKLGLAAAFVQTILPWDILFSRSGFEGHLATLWYALGIWLILLARRHPKWWYLASIVLATAVYTYFSARIVIPGLVILSIAMMPRRLNGFIHMGLAGLLWILLLLPMMQSNLYQTSNQFRLSTASLLNSNQHVLDQNTWRDAVEPDQLWIARVISHRSLLWFDSLLFNIFAHLDWSYLFLYGDANLRHSTGRQGLLMLSMLPMVILGMIRLARNKPVVGVWLLGLWLWALLPASIPTDVPHALRSMLAMPAVVLITAYGLEWLIKLLDHKWQWLMYSFVLVLVLEISIFWHDYLNHYPLRSAEDWQYGYHQLFEYLKDHYDEASYLYIHPKDRLYLYAFLSGLQPHEWNTIHKDHEGYEYVRLDKYFFTRLDEQRIRAVSGSSKAIIASDQYTSLSPELQSLVERILYDYNGSPQFIVLDLKSLE